MGSFYLLLDQDSPWITARDLLVEASPVASGYPSCPTYFLVLLRQSNHILSCVGGWKTPLKTIWKSVGMIWDDEILNWMETNLFPTTNQLLTRMDLLTILSSSPFHTAFHSAPLAVSHDDCWWILRLIFSWYPLIIQHSYGSHGPVESWCVFP